MPSTLPDGDPAPADGRLPSAALGGAAGRPLGIYLHVPFCRTRCGYCDFNTYTAEELGEGVSRASYVDSAIRELEFARAVLDSDDRQVSTVFVGGGTPTLLPAADLGRLLSAVRDLFGLARGAEVTTESNPESVDKRALQDLRAAGFTRVSFGMQSAREHVLAVLDRQHTPGRVDEAVRDARRAGFDNVSVDLIYGTPGESDDDWRASVSAAIGTGADHVSAYSLIVEPGTRLAARVKRGELPMPDDDVLADRYVIADEMLAAAGFDWYEVSNWAKSEHNECRHNLGYWTGGDWWGIGPGAHSHVGGVRWWNVKHPKAYAERVDSGCSPAYARELLDDLARHTEDVMLRVRLRDGLVLSALTPDEQAAARQACDDGLLDRAEFDGGRTVLTLRGRLLADAVVRTILD
ncbi:MAG TPA: radical SAM family heme chaperone HemW [Mycobacteriales bacterium]|jgi:oxygen-independent coproporphyrinogen-3 oxidase|nr:radical SAM family heme chaperone HemW [Mycobacteriales bacterium]